MKDLVVKFWRIENTVLMQVLEQDENTRGKGVLYYGKTNEMRLNSLAYPEISSDGMLISVRGYRKDNDETVTPHEFDCANDAKEFLTRAKELISAYNESRRLELPVNIGKIEIETMIVR